MGLNFPNAPTVGQLYPSPPLTGVPVYQWDGQKWLVLAGGLSPVYVGDAPPSNPPNGALWWNSTTAQLYIYYVDVNSSQWVMIVSSPAPTTTAKNYVLNGAMMVSQENGSAAGTTNAFYAADQFLFNIVNTTGTAQIQQVASRTPSGSPNRLRVTVTTADAAQTTNKYVSIMQTLEGLRVADLNMGLVTAKSVVLQFGVKAPAGTYCVSFRNAGITRSYVGECVVAPGEANTDVVKTIALALDTTGTWASDNTVGMYLQWSLMCGPTYQAPAGAWTAGNFPASPNQFNFMGTINNVFELFDVGLYVGSAAPPFQVPDYVTELQLCRRYFEGCDDVLWTMAYAAATSVARMALMCGVKKRAPPALVTKSLAAVSFNYYASNISPTGLTAAAASVYGIQIDATVSGTPFPAGSCVFVGFGAGSVYFNARM
jgi:hypothetical protein